jgi:hypothetical protein
VKLGLPRPGFVLNGFLCIGEIPNIVECVRHAAELAVGRLGEAGAGRKSLMIMHYPDAKRKDGTFAFDGL